MRDPQASETSGIVAGNRGRCSRETHRRGGLRDLLVAGRRSARTTSRAVTDFWSRSYPNRGARRPGVNQAGWAFSWSHHHAGSTRFPPSPPAENAAHASSSAPGGVSGGECFCVGIACRQETMEQAPREPRSLASQRQQLRRRLADTLPPASPAVSRLRCRGQAEAYVDLHHVPPALADPAMVKPFGADRCRRCLLRWVSAASKATSQSASLSHGLA